jgi:hypothetical protein
MDKIAFGSAADRRDLFRESASQLGMNPAIVEKTSGLAGFSNTFLRSLPLKIR